MKSLAHPNLVRSLFAGMLLCMTSVPCLAQQDTESSAGELPFDVFNQPIDIAQIYMHLEKNASLQETTQAPDAVEAILNQLKTAQTSSDIELDSLVSQPVPSSTDLYSHMVKSSLFLGQFYDCGKCDRSHLSASGGVVISESGLALTNYHVLALRKNGTTEGFMAMTFDGKCFEVEKVLAADKLADIALVQLKSGGYKFHAAPIAKKRPRPMKDVQIISHPAGEFFTFTSGQVSRYSKVKNRSEDQGRRNPAWLEITADFGGGSSGSGVFNAAGEVVGVVSRIRPLKRAASKIMVNGKEMTKPSYVEMLIKRCADLDSIKACFASEKTDADSPTVGAAAKVLQGD